MCGRGRTGAAIDLARRGMLGFAMPDSEGEQLAPAELPALGWRSLPLVDDFPRSLLLVCAVVGICVAVGLSFGDVGYALLAAALVMVSLARYFLPTRFDLDDAGATARFLGQSRRMLWSQVGRVSAQKAGVFLSPFDRPSRLDSFRGVLLRFAGNAEKVVSFVEHQMARAE